MTSPMTTPALRQGPWPALRALLPHLWPKGEPAMRVRVALALLCLVLAKAANLVVPLFFKRLEQTHADDC